MSAADRTKTTRFEIIKAMRVAQLNKQRSVTSTSEVLEGNAAIVTIQVNQADELYFLGKFGLSHSTAHVTTFERMLAIDPFLRNFESFEPNTRYERTASGSWIALS